MCLVSPWEGSEGLLIEMRGELAIKGGWADGERSFLCRRPGRPESRGPDDSAHDSGPS